MSIHIIFHFFATTMLHKTFSHTFYVLGILFLYDRSLQFVIAESKEIYIFHLNASCQMAFWQGRNTSYFYRQCRKIPFSLQALNKYLNQLVLIYVIFLIRLEIISSFCAKWCHGRQSRERLRKSHGVRQSSVCSFCLFSKYFSGTYSRCWKCTRHWSNF